MYVAAIIEVVLDAWFGIDTQLWDDVVLYANGSTYRPLCTVFLHLHFRSVCHYPYFDVEIGLCTCRCIDVKTMPLPGVILHVQRNADVVERHLLLVDKIVCHVCEVRAQTGVDDS